VVGAQAGHKIDQVLWDRLASVTQAGHVGIDRSDILTGRGDLVGDLCSTLSGRELPPPTPRGDEILNCLRAGSGHGPVIDYRKQLLDGPYDPQWLPKVPMGRRRLDRLLRSLADDDVGVGRRPCR
jgi:hypothetical protein